MEFIFLQSESYITYHTTNLLCTNCFCLLKDVDLGGILELIRSNLKLNAELVKAPVTVTALDFYCQNWSEELTELMGQVDLVLAADGKSTIHINWLNTNTVSFRLFQMRDFKFNNSHSISCKKYTFK